MIEVCAQLDFEGEPKALATRVVDPLGNLLGAESAAFRVFALERGTPRVTTLVSRGMPNSVTDAYLGRYHRMDPAFELLGDRHAPDAASFLRYRNEFLVPNGMVHHVGFSLRDESGGRVLLFNFHRAAASLPFGELETARARMLQLSLQGKVLRSRFGAGYGPDVEALSVRELDVAKAVAAGSSNKQIAIELGISIRTVENHLRAIHAKLRVASRPGLVALLNRRAAG